ncbi:MAG: VTT domain-containing protein, partial [Solirubrobacterales bacterium]
GEERFLRMERLVHRGGAIALIGVRMIPIMPFVLMGYVCGAARIPLWRYTWTTAVGYAPITAYFTYLGSRLQGFSAEDPILWIGGGVLIICIFGVRFLLPRVAPDSADGN